MSQALEMTARRDIPQRATSPLGDLLRAVVGNRARPDEPMARHTSFRIGGPADWWVVADAVGEISAVFRIARELGVPLTTIGTGTNLLVADRGIRGIVLHLGRPFSVVEWQELGDEAVVRAGAAAPFKRLVYDAVARGFAGLEFGEGIPGTVGGGLVMNAGAFGGEIGRVVDELDGVEVDGTPVAVPRERLAFSYRRLDLPAGFLVTGVVLRLRRGDADEMSAWVRGVSQRRKSNQPLGFPNAGSIFKNPPGAFAGKLLEEAGFKGLRRGGARVSERHANFIVNEKSARAADVRALIDEMQSRVLERSGIRLEPEVKLIGEW